MRTVLACAILFFTPLTCSGDEPPVWKPESFDLLFTSGRDGNSEIYLLPAGQKALP